MPIGKRVSSLVLPAIFIASFSLPALADCDEVLKYGIWDTYDKSSIDQTDQSFANAICSRSRKTESGSIEIFGYGKADGSTSASEDICRNEQGALKINHVYVESIKKASEAILRHWRAGRKALT